MVWLQYFSPGRPRPARRNVSSSLRRRRIVADNRAAELPHNPVVVKVVRVAAPRGPPAAPNAPGRVPKEPERVRAAATVSALTFARTFAWAAIAMLHARV